MSKLKKIECEFFHLKLTTKKIVGQATSASYWSYDWKTESFEEYGESF
jgi:hypothetical protein